MRQADSHAKDMVVASRFATFRAVQGYHFAIDSLCGGSRIALTRKYFTILQGC